MNTSNELEELETYVPPIPLPAEDWSREPAQTKTPIRVGDAVVPKFVPVLANGRSKHQIKTKESLIVKSIEGDGDSSIVTFEGQEGFYSTFCFKKAS